jgi:hypothetical protein
LGTQGFVVNEEFEETRHAHRHPEKYAEMLDAAKKGAFAFPAINVSSSQTLNAALQGFAEAGRTGSSRSRPAARSTSPVRPSRTW